MKYILNRYLLRRLVNFYNNNKYIRNYAPKHRSFCTTVERREKIEDKYDIVISGGGMVGFGAGCALGRSRRLADKKILLLERQPARKWELPEEFSNRVCSLNHQTIQLSSDVGAWELMQAMRVQPVKKMQVWESCSESMITFDKEDDEVGVVSHVVENDVVLDALKSRIPGNVEVRYGVNVSNYDLPSSVDNLVGITLSSGEKLSANLLVGADGAHSSVRKAMGCNYLAWEYDQMGIVATLHLSEAEENSVAWQKFLPTGPVAFLPLSPNRSSLVWSTTRKNAATLMSLDDMDFVDALNNVMWQDEPSDPLVRNILERWQTLLQTFAPGGCSNVGLKQLPPCVSKIEPRSRASFPLGLCHAAQYVAPRVALIGDAAHRIHPLAGQGVNLGFGDVTCLLQTLEGSVLQGADIGDPQELYRYETSRQRHNVSTMSAVDILYRLYSTKFVPLVLLRSLGLSAVDALTPLKKRIMGHAET